MKVGSLKKMQPILVVAFMAGAHTITPEQAEKIKETLEINKKVKLIISDFNDFPSKDKQLTLKEALRLEKSRLADLEAEFEMPFWQRNIKNLAQHKKHSVKPRPQV